MKTNQANSNTSISYDRFVETKGYVGYEDELEALLRDSGISVFSVRKKGFPPELAESIPVRQGFVLNESKSYVQDTGCTTQDSKESVRDSMSTEDLLTPDEVLSIVRVQAGIEVSQEDLETAIECLEFEDPKKIPGSALTEILALLQWGMAVELQRQVINRSAGLDSVIQEAQLNAARQQGQVVALLEQTAFDSGYLEIKGELTNSRITQIEQQMNAGLNSSLEELNARLDLGKQTISASQKAWTNSYTKQQSSVASIQKARLKLSKKLAT